MLLHNIGRGWTAWPQRCFLGSHFVPFNQFPAPVASTRPNEEHFILWDKQWETQVCSQCSAQSPLRTETQSLPVDSQCLPGSHLHHHVSSTPRTDFSQLPSACTARHCMWVAKAANLVPVPLRRRSPQILWQEAILEASTYQRLLSLLELRQL